ncbi:uncharacterized protein LOC143037237 isoform X2 [Oratosquilla oratoria]
MSLHPHNGSLLHTILRAKQAAAEDTPDSEFENYSKVGEVEWRLKMNASVVWADCPECGDASIGRLANQVQEVRRQQRNTRILAISRQRPQQGWRK